RGRTEGQTDSVVELHDSTGHHVRAGMPKDSQSGCVAGSEQSERNGILFSQFIERTSGINDLPINLCGNGRLSEPLSNRSGNIESGGPGRKLFNGSIGKLNLHGAALSISLQIGDARHL